MLVVVLSLSSAAGFSVPSSRAACLANARTVPQTSRVLRAVKNAPEKTPEMDKAVSEPLEEIEGLDGWLIKMGLKADERVSTIAMG